MIKREEEAINMMKMVEKNQMEDYRSAVLRAKNVSQHVMDNEDAMSKMMRKAAQSPSGPAFVVDKHGNRQRR